MGVEGNKYCNRCCSGTGNEICRFTKLLFKGVGKEFHILLDNNTKFIKFGALLGSSNRRYFFPQVSVFLNNNLYFKNSTNYHFAPRYSSLSRLNVTVFLKNIPVLKPRHKHKKIKTELSLKKRFFKNPWIRMLLTHLLTTIQLSVILLHYVACFVAF